MWKYEETPLKGLCQERDYTLWFSAVYIYAEVKAHQLKLYTDNIIKTFYSFFLSYKDNYIKTCLTITYVEKEVIIMYYYTIVTAAMPPA